MKKLLLFGMVFLICLCGFANAGIILNSNAYDVFDINTNILSSNITQGFVNNADEVNDTIAYSITYNDTGKVICAVENNMFVSYPSESFSGNGTCILNATFDNETNSTNVTITVHSLSEIGLEEQGTRYSGGGSSSSSEPELIVIDVINETEKDIFGSLTESLTGEKVIVSKGEILFELTTDVGTDNFKIYVRPGDERTRNLIVKNNGLQSITLSASCEGAYCSNVYFSRDKLTVNANSQESIPITMKVPDGAEIGTEYQFDILVSLIDDTSVSGVVSGRVIVDYLLGLLSKAVSFENLFKEGITIGNIFISNIVISFLASIGFFALVSLIISFIKPIGFRRFIFELTRWLGLIFVFVLMIFLL